MPVTFNDKDSRAYADLAGVSTEVVAACNGQRFREKMLITHRGLSGPAILQISSYWQKGTASPRSILVPEREITKSLAQPGAPRTAAALRTALQTFLPNRLADRWLDIHPPAAFTNVALRDIEQQIHEWKMLPAGTEGFAKAEVTVGGVDTDELSAKTMESRKVPGLFFIGEVVDVTGHLGGFNFQWAWASGAAAGRAIVEEKSARRVDFRRDYKCVKSRCIQSVWPTARPKDRARPNRGTRRIPTTSNFSD